MNGCKKRLDTKARYKRNYDNPLRQNKTLIKPDDDVFVLLELKDEKETREKMTPIAEGLLRMKGVYMEENSCHRKYFTIMPHTCTNAKVRRLIFGCYQTTNRRKTRNGSTRT